MTPPAEDTTGLELFDETATAAGNFPVSLRGYDRGAVDAYVRDVESQLAHAKRQVRNLQRKLTEANLRVDDTDFSKLGAHTRGLLKAAEAQASELVASAEARARQLLSEAEASAERATLEARLALDASQASTLADITRIREQLSAQTATELRAARDESAALRAAAERDREQVLQEARLASDALIESGRLEGEQLRLTAEREVAEARLALAQEKESTQADLQAAAQTARKSIEDLVAKARKQAEDYRAALEQDALTWDERRQAALNEAAEIRIGAQDEARTMVEAAQNQAARILTDARDTGSERQAQLERDIERLTLRKQAIVAQLTNLSALAGQSVSEFPDQGDAPPAEPERAPQP